MLWKAPPAAVSEPQGQNSVILIMKEQQNIQNINPSPENIYSQTPQTTPETKAKSNKIIPILIIIFFICTISATAYFLGTKNFFKKNIIVDNQSQSNSTPSPEETPLLTGKLQKLDQDLKIFQELNDGGEGKSTYYSAGIFNKGDLQGYTRIIATNNFGPGDNSVYILATKDFQTYILDDPDQNTTKYPEKDYQNPYSKLDKTKISSTKIFDTYQPKSIKLDDNLSLYYESIPTNSHETTQKDTLGNTLYEYLINADFSTFKSLNSPDKNLTFYYQPISRPEYFDQWDQKSKNNQLIKEKFISTTSEITVIDPIGLPVTYLLAFNKNVNSYQPNSDSTSLSIPHLSFVKSDIQNSTGLNFYSTYDVAIPSGCAITPETVVTNFTDSDLEKIGTVFNIPIYRLKNQDGDFSRLAFSNKIDYFDNYDKNNEEWNSVNEGIKKPNLNDYLNNNPLIFIKDYWQRWVAMGEYDIKLPGGCGKPVVYLYPEKTTEVSVKFNAPIQFTTDIPEYKNSWNVLASPNGSLQDLNQKDGDCNKIDSSKFGSEYATEACKTNNYPYLYWSGNIISQKYPDMTKGWIIAKEDLKNFLQQKLTEINFSSQEKNDFISYWLPELLNKNSSYYRISFLQTGELNKIFPMTVTPTPDTIFRIFLDYQPLSQKPSQSIQPQNLSKLVRHGFTLVEWGGLKR